MKYLTNKQQESYEMQNYAIFVDKNLKANMLQIKNLPTICNR